MDRYIKGVGHNILNDKVVPFFEQHDLELMRMLTDRGTEYCGNRENHEYELYLAGKHIDHSKIKAKSTQTNGICERFNRTRMRLQINFPANAHIVPIPMDDDLSSLSAVLMKDDYYHFTIGHSSVDNEDGTQIANIEKYNGYLRPKSYGKEFYSR